MGKLNDSLFSSKDQTWETPQDLFDKLDNIFKFDLDVCATDKTAKCDNYFTPEVDGLQQKWNGVCWMNPPYGREQIKWIEKAHKESLDGAKIICLIPARPDTQVWQNIIFPNAKVILFIKGRLKFGGSKDSAPFPSALIVFGECSDVQMKELSQLGSLVKII